MEPWGVRALTTIDDWSRGPKATFFSHFIEIESVSLKKCVQRVGVRKDKMCVLDIKE